MVENFDEPYGEVITEKDGIEMSYRWFASRKKAEALTFQLKPSRS